MKGIFKIVKLRKLCMRYNNKLYMSNMLTQFYGKIAREIMDGWLYFYSWGEVRSPFYYPSNNHTSY